MLRLGSRLLSDCYSSAPIGAGMQREYNLFCKMPLGNPAILERLHQIGGFASRSFERFALIETLAACLEIRVCSSS